MSCGITHKQTEKKKEKSGTGEARQVRACLIYVFESGRLALFVCLFYALCAGFCSYKEKRKVSAQSAPYRVKENENGNVP